jgi:tRNA/tmRNA/rRNA uracil-C5-methylase (TrmA/RlmC/RlmD family)
MRRDELIAIHECPVHSPRVNGLVALLRAHLPPGDELPLAYLHVAGGQATLVVKARRVDTALLQPLVDVVPASGLDGLWLHCHASAGRRLFARAGWELLWGAPRSVAQGGLIHGPASFQQLLPALHRESLDLAEAHLRPAPGCAVLDLYCGIGASLRRWTGAGAEALGIELAGDAVACATHNAPAAAVLRGTCVQRLPQVREWWSRQPGDRVLYVNPPRSGLESALLASIAGELRPVRLAYLSCSAGTLARDLGGLQHAGYRIDALRPFDFFPGTQHVEVLATGTLAAGA